MGLSGSTPWVLMRPTVVFSALMPQKAAGRRT